MFAFLQSHARFLGAFSLGAVSGIDLLVTHQDQINQLIGAAIVIVTVVTSLVHDYELKRAQLEAKTLNPQPLPPGATPPTPPAA